MEIKMLEVYAITDVGVSRKLNQDFIYAKNTPVGNLANLFIVADGMGGHNAGDFASKCAVEIMNSEIRGDGDNDVKEILTRAIQKANEVILQISRAQNDMSGMGTTLVVATYKENRLQLFNVGDSRLYIMEEQLEQITLDHSYVEEMVRLHALDREEANSNPNKNKITRAVGVADALDADYFEIEVKEGAYILMCTDGLTNMVTDKEIETILSTQQTIMQKAVNLVETANYNGGRDNISVILIKI
ncbi:MAG: Stp1/IreP family PP2C-type Ser/Thr phosphatase [Eubacteriales bacterium]